RVNSGTPRWDQTWADWRNHRGREYHSGKPGTIATVSGGRHHSGRDGKLVSVLWRAGFLGIRRTGVFWSGVATAIVVVVTLTSRSRPWLMMKSALPTISAAVGRIGT